MSRSAFRRFVGTRKCSDLLTLLDMVMKNIDLGQMIQIVANVGVIAGIAFLAFELRQNNELLEAQAREAVHERRTNGNLLLATTPDLTDIFAKVDAGEGLTRSESLRLSAFNRATLASMEWQYGEYRRGRLSLSDLALPSWTVGFSGGGVSRGLGDTWVEWKRQATPDFIAFMEENVVP